MSKPEVEGTCVLLCSPASMGRRLVALLLLSDLRDSLSKVR